jgi:hypothetical protein
MDSLRAMFPDVDEDGLLAAYEGCDRNVEAAVELLLGEATQRVLQRVESHPHAAEDASLAAAQIAQDEELARQLQEELLMQDQPHSHHGHPSFDPGFGGAARLPGGGYPGWDPTIATAGAHQHAVFRPAQWGSEAAPTPPSEGLGIASGISSAGSAVAGAASSLFSSLWGASGSEDKTREEGAREMQPMQRAPGGEGEAVAGGGDAYTRPPRELYEREARDLMPSEAHGEAEVPTEVVIGGSSSTGAGGRGDFNNPHRGPGGDGMRRRAARHVDSATNAHEDLM